MNARAPLRVAGSDDSWQNIHPDVIHVPGGFAGYPYWMVFTPYRLGNDRLENPTVRVSYDGIRWQRMIGTPDPLVPPPLNSGLHHADPELFFEPPHLHVIYLTICDRSCEATFNVVTCANDLRWSEPKIIYKDIGAVSPTFQFDGEVVHAWFIRVSPTDPCHSELLHREGSDLNSLGNERKCDLDIPGRTPWHIDVLRVEDGYEALVAAYRTAAPHARRTELFHLTSKDGMTFNLSRLKPILKPSSLGWDNRYIYRSSFLKEEDGSYRIWYSGGSWGYECGIGLLQGSLDRLSDPAIGLARQPRYVSRLPHELAGLLRWQIRRIVPPSLLSPLPSMFFHNKVRPQA